MWIRPERHAVNIFHAIRRRTPRSITASWKTLARRERATILRVHDGSLASVGTAVLLSASEVDHE